MQHAIQTALGGYQSINELILPGAACVASGTSLGAFERDPRGLLRQAQGALYMFPRLDPKVYDIRDDQKMVFDLLQQEKLLLVQGTGFNWPAPDHFRLVFLPREEELEEAIGRLARFLKGYKQ
jgi:alanine-synthesizing transaminase